VPDYDATLDDYLRQLNLNGISNGVLVQPSFLGTDNSFLLDALQRQPGCLRGIAVVRPDIAKSELVDLDRRGIVGIRLNLVGAQIPDFKSDPWPSFMRIVADLGWQVEIQRTSADLPIIADGLLKTGVNVVIDHFGLPDQKLGVNDPGFRSLLSSAASSRRIWLKLSGMYRNGAGAVGDAMTRAAMPLLRQSFGVERLLWGSDWPHTQFEKIVDYSKARAHLDAWLPDPAERKAVLADTPARLFRFCGARVQTL
jgi:predicted TIM-barrel fold metal-dependent hydrolase